ncbi:MAG TPA: glycosyltransferase, partial [Steroidobacteraceae bacterium]|nr:glycosyltransferase [Steroidobacteraceae bacterium]
HGSNAKVSNLINTLPVARHDTLVISDSDVHVAPDYLDTVVPPLADPSVGLVTCAYRARPDASPWSRLVALFVNGWFMPAMRVGALFGSRNFASGATLALRRGVLDRIGGFAAIADQLADDFWLGERIRRAGFTTVLAPITVETCVNEPGPRACIAHELRWLRTIRGIQPLGYAFSFITFGLPVGLLTTAALRGAGGTWILFALTLIARFIVHFADDSGRRAWRDVWLVPTSDALAVALWCWSFAGRRVRWRRGSLVAAPGGNALRIT